MEVDKDKRLAPQEKSINNNAKYIWFEWMNGGISWISTLWKRLSFFKERWKRFMSCAILRLIGVRQSCVWLESEQKRLCYLCERQYIFQIWMSSEALQLSQKKNLRFHPMTTDNKVLRIYRNSFFFLLRRNDSNSYDNASFKSSILSVQCQLE
jgi:hypothetical protein